MEVVQQYKFSQEEEKELRSKFDAFLGGFFTSPEEAKEKLAQLLRPEVVVRTEASYTKHPLVPKEVANDQEGITIRDFCVSLGMSNQATIEFRIWLNARRTYMRKADYTEQFPSLGRKGNKCLYSSEVLEKAMKVYTTK